MCNLCKTYKVRRLDPKYLVGRTFKCIEVSGKDIIKTYINCDFIADRFDEDSRWNTSGIGFKPALESSFSMFHFNKLDIFYHIGNDHIERLRVKLSYKDSDAVYLLEEIS
jgi:hypothetical protein